MQRQIIADLDTVFDFVKQHTPMNRVEGMHGLGLLKDGEMQAGVLYEGFNGHNVWMHVAAVPGARWMTKLFLQTCFYYPFVTLGCGRVSGYVEASNTQARRFDEHLGFLPEAVLESAAADGGDVILYVMRREDCRYA
jgi:gamma-glutamylcyclotransferase (GGCT)/AIG2-like uncharacterized protein YtfP